MVDGDAPSSAHDLPTAAAVFTEELEAVISTDVAAGDTLKVEAMAGSGKSTMLRIYAERRPELRILYLTFTEAEAREKQADYNRRGLSHVSVSTLHARAFQASFELHHGKVVDQLLLSAESIAKVTCSSSLDWPAARRNALCRVLERFFSSDAEELGDAHLSGETAPAGLLGAARAVWQAALQGGVPLSHDMYLKQCCLSPTLRVSMFDGIDLVLLDEAHDCTEAQISLVEAPHGRTWASIMVMDFRQRIYGWRRAASEAYLRALPAIAVRRLSFTWRFGGALATLVSTLLSHHTHDRQSARVVVGNHFRRTQIREVESPPFAAVCGAGGCLVVVARTRLSLFQTAMSSLLSGAVESISFGGNADAAYSMFGGREKLLDTYALSIGRSRDAMLVPQHGAARFTELGFAAFRSAATALDSREAMEACFVVLQYGAALPQLLRKLDAALRSASPRAVLLVSVHEAKGREWPFVYLHSDLRRQVVRHAKGSLDRDGDVDGSYRLNLMYVAMTRATTTLFLPSSIVASWLRTLNSGLPGVARALSEVKL